MPAIESLPTLTSTTLASEAARVLRTAVLSGQFELGQHLVEADLADALDVSRATVREALRILRGEGLIVSSPHKGSYVVELDREDVIEIYEVRLALETLAVCRLCRTLTEDQEQHLLGLIEDMRTVGEGCDRYVFPLSKLDMQFHEALCRFSGNKRLWTAWKHLGNQMTLYFAAFPAKFEVHEFPQRHQAILDAITSCDPESALHVMMEHIHDAVSRILPDTEFPLSIMLA